MEPWKKRFPFFLETINFRFHGTSFHGWNQFPVQPLVFRFQIQHTSLHCLRPMDSRAGSLLLRNVRRSLSWRSSTRRWSHIIFTNTYEIVKANMCIYIHITYNWKPYFYGALDNFFTRPGGTTKSLSKSCRNRALIFRSKSWWEEYPNPRDSSA